jgi:hypothetical protein
MDALKWESRCMDKKRGFSATALNSSMSSLLNLPPVPPELKAVTPFLTRAGELVNQDPVISYWC